MAKPISAGRAALAAAGLGTAALMSVGSPAPAQAQNLEQEWEHLVECVDWLLNDPDLHARYCSPSRVAPLFASLSEQSSGAAPPPPVSEVPR